MINFALFGQPNKTGDKITIYLRINQDSKKVRISTRMIVPAKNWKQSAQMVIKGGDFDLAFYREKLTKIVNSVDGIVRTANLESWELSDVQKEVLTLFNVSTPEPKGVLSLYKEWSTVGTAQKKTPRRQDRQTYSVFAEYVQQKDLPFIKIDYSFYNDFLIHLRTNKKYKENTVGTHIKNLKAVMNEGFKRKLHTNIDFQNFHKPQENIININLNEQELMRIYGVNVSGYLEQIKDIFILGCYVAQRHSDYSRISFKDVKDNYITIVQKKTNRRIVIPLHPIAREILDKYKGVLPSISLTQLNKEIKEIARLAKINENILVRETKAGKVVERYVPKCELISSHTARKSGVTNALRAGVPIEDCMYLAGIKSPEVFRKYVGIADEEYTERLANSSFFSGNSDIEGMLLYVANVIRSGESPEWLKRLTKAYGTHIKKK